MARLLQIDKMPFEKRVPSEFGIIIPRDNGIYWKKQGGGMSPRQYTLEGVYIPIGKIHYRLGFPDWSPSGPNFEEKLKELDFESLPERDIQSFPEQVVERGYFYSSDEYLNWIDDSEWYGNIELWDELYRFTYGIFDLLDSDPRERWKDVDDLWAAIDNSFSFRYQSVSYDEYQQLGLDDYPAPEAAIRPIRIKGSKEDSQGKTMAPWANELNGQIAFLMCPNAD